MNRCAVKHCPESTFADFDRCIDHVPRVAMACEVIRLRALLLDARAALADERARHEHNHAAPANRSELTILERMG